jgi:pimeloyl-[acyl-carrier protein] synthase
MTVPSFNPYNQQFQLNPYSTYARLRKQAPIFKTIFDTWIVTSYALSDFILKDSRFEIDNLPQRLDIKSTNYINPDFAKLSKIIDKWITFINPPDHGRLKRAISPSFTLQAIEELRPYISEVISSYLINLKDDIKFDLMNDLGNPLSALSITKLLGLPEADALQIQAWCADTVSIFDQPATLETYETQAIVLTECSDYLKTIILQQRKEPNPGLLSYLISQQGLSNGLTDEEIIGTTILLAATGQESTKGLFGNGILALLMDLNSLNALQEKPELIGKAVEELLRFDSPIQYVARRASEDVMILNNAIYKGDYVVVYLGAANRDPEVYDKPDQLDFYRKTKNLGFGAGLHYCIGSFLAKLEMEIVLTFLLDRFAHRTIEVGPVTRSKSRISRRLLSLPITIRSIL